jgi:predicted HTH transcriptional regulator
VKIADAIARGEGPRLDFKRDLSSPKSVLKDIVAFANTAGGTVVIGLDDDGSIVGVADPLREEERLSSRISDGIEPQLLPEVYAVSHGEHELLVVEVAHHPAPFRLRAEGPERGVYVRLGSTSRRAEPETLAELRRQAAGESFDLFARSDVALGDLDESRMKAAFEGHDVPLRVAKLEALGVLTRYQGNVVATNAGVILFGQETRRAGATSGTRGSREHASRELHEQPTSRTSSTLTRSSRCSRRSTSQSASSGATPAKPSRSREGGCSVSPLPSSPP